MNHPRAFDDASGLQGRAARDKDRDRGKEQPAESTLNPEHLTQAEALRRVSQYGRKTHKPHSGWQTSRPAPRWTGQFASPHHDGVEAGPNPGAALAAADRLRFYAPGAGHLVHLPSHIYIRVSQCGPKRALEAPRLRHLPWLTLVRFGRWDDVLAIAKPPKTNDFLVDRALWHFTRGLAFAARKDPTAAESEQTALDAIAASDEALAAQWLEPFRP